ncbi:hypothetical protein EDD17DRAFT_1761952 [Pisolithus thermaeus]|nr:hypothetical protein EV401DRAFT_2120560 [Pisolithus croceorrhizus]KAI6159896.1 hypothetical protein EDD17DRAFT_1761952 [Pisolithus thermaeus]
MSLSILHLSKWSCLQRKAKATVFDQEEEKDVHIKECRVPLVKLDFSVAEGKKAKECLEMIKQSVPHDKAMLFKAEGPQKLIEGLEPVLEEEAQEFMVNIWRQVIFESMAYGEGLQTEHMVVD